MTTFPRDDAGQNTRRRGVNRTVADPGLYASGRLRKPAARSPRSPLIVPPPVRLAVQRAGEHDLARNAVLAAAQARTMPDIRSLSLARAPRLRRIAQLVDAQADRAANPAKARALARNMRLRAADLEGAADARHRDDQEDDIDPVEALAFAIGRWPSPDGALHPRVDR